MKFAKELERDLVPEWRIKYLNYKAGKKYVKALSRSINRANATPSIARRGDRISTFTSTTTPRRTHNGRAPDEAEAEAEARPVPTTQPKSHSIPIGNSERDALSSSPGAQLQYGSFVTTPVIQSSAAGPDRPNPFELPGPAIRNSFGSGDEVSDLPKTPGQSARRTPLMRSKSMGAPASSPYGPSQGPNQTPRMASNTPRQRLVRMFTSGSPLTRRTSRDEYGMHAIDEVRDRERDFFSFMDRELEKVEGFYQQKEEQAGKRLELLRQQLREMRNRRIEEIAEIRKRKEEGHSNGDNSNGSHEEGENSNGNGKDSGAGRRWVDPIKDKIFKPGPNSKALQKMVRTPVMTGMSPADRRDYITRAADDEVPYRTAKRKLKLALQEFYRGLELLKSYALLNRTAFRKLNKKYDKAVNARPPYRYLNEKVNKAWFVNSDVLDGHITLVEDLYARYFERGNHKIAAGKLRSLSKRPADQSNTTFRSGILIGVGLVFAIQGLVYGAELLFHPEDEVMRQRTAYLLQIYGGYFLMLYMFMLFCLDCRMWTKNKINYPFIFEFDPRHHLDWRELAEFPCFFLFLFGLFIWLNFSMYGDTAMYLYYPVILIFVSMMILFVPAPIFRSKSRKWFLYSHYRLFFAGLYPVEFRDFFLGDIYCSLTYATCNVELFFCLYANYWNDPEQCNSNHSRLMGFLAALPPIWRAFQCLRRYYDTRNSFPHLANCGKYSMSITAAVCLSLYRIHRSHTNLALFITFSTINAVYCSIWDIFMDFSLLQPHTRHPFLRDIIALHRPWMYYGIMILDPILRFSWIFYAIFTHDTQHSTVVSFLVAFAEVTRRGMWTLFRVENEHCANVAQYRASRDVPLPYHLEPILQRPSLEAVISPEEEAAAGPTTAQGPSPQQPPPSTGRSSGVEVPGAGRVRRPSAGLLPAAALEEGVGATAAAEESGTVVRRRRTDTIGRMSIAKIMAEAHKQDFEKKRKPADEAGRATSSAGDAAAAVDHHDEIDEEDEDDDEDDDSGSLLDERMQAREVVGLTRGKGVDDSE